MTTPPLPNLRRSVGAFAVLVAALLVMLPQADGRRRNTTARKLRTEAPKAQTETTVEPFDTVAAMPDSIRFYGYDKPLRSTRETLFVSNCSASRTVAAVIFTIDYTDTSGRQLHRRRVVQRTEIPPGETRKLDFPSWDRQQTFRYLFSPKTRASSIPYDVKVHADTLLLER